MEGRKKEKKKKESLLERTVWNPLLPERLTWWW